ncbi:MAG: TdeIII family type II restriction endonuclease [Bacteroidales bacterium]|nr:TdeIII family type II restriction endonuclease [Bacteroidales bacterium]
MKKNTDDISKEINNVIQTLMDRVMEKVLVTDPFISESHRAKKPLYAALVPDEIFKGSHFERRFVTPFGGVWEKLAQVAGKAGLGLCELQKTISGNVPQERLVRIAEVLNKLEHAPKGEKKIKPDWENELKYILKGKGELIPTIVISDVYAENTLTGEKYAFELKAPLPNSDQSKVSKEKIFKLYAMEPKVITSAYFALPYNPYGRKENYAWSFPYRWFDMKKDEIVLIGDEFWDFIGGKGTYDSFIIKLNSLGKVYKERILTEYLGIEPKNLDVEVLK